MNKKRRLTMAFTCIIILLTALCVKNRAADAAADTTYCYWANGFWQANGKIWINKEVSDRKPYVYCDGNNKNAINSRLTVGYYRTLVRPNRFILLYDEPVTVPANGKRNYELKEADITDRLAGEAESPTISASLTAYDSYERSAEFYVAPGKVRLYYGWGSAMQQVNLGIKTLDEAVAENSIAPANVKDPITEYCVWIDNTAAYQSLPPAHEEDVKELKTDTDYTEFNGGTVSVDKEALLAGKASRITTWKVKPQDKPQYAHLYIKTQCGRTAISDCLIRFGKFRVVYDGADGEVVNAGMNVKTCTDPADESKQKYCYEAGTKFITKEWYKKGHRFIMWRGGDNYLEKEEIAMTSRLLNECNVTPGTASNNYVDLYTLNLKGMGVICSYDVTCIDKTESGAELGRSCVQKVYGSSVSGSDISSKTYTGYTYKSCTSATVDDTNGTTVYRYFTPNKYSLEVDYNGGSADTAATNDDAGAQFVNKEGTYTDIGPDRVLAVAAPKMNGATFKGWKIEGYDNSNTNQLWSGQKSGWNMIKNIVDSNSVISTAYYRKPGIRIHTLTNLRKTSGTVSLTADWRADQYTVTYDANANGGIYTSTSKKKVSSNIYKSTVTYGATAPVGEKAAKTGASFKGWYDAKTGGTQVYDKTGTVVKNTKYTDGGGKWIYADNVTLYAVFSAKKYPVKCIDVLQKPSGSEEHEYWSEYYEYGSTARGSDFNEGSIDEYYDNYKYSHCSEITVSDAAANNVVYRYFVPKSQCEVIFDAARNGGTYTDSEKTRISDNIYKTYAVYGEPMPSIGAAHKEGYEFLGWFTNPTIPTEESKVYDKNGTPVSQWYTDYKSGSWAKWNCDYCDTDTFYAHFEKIEDVLEINIYAEEEENPDRYYDSVIIEKYGENKNADGYWYKDEVSVTAEGECNYSSINYVYQYVKDQYDVTTSRGNYNEEIFKRTYQPAFQQINSDIAYDKVIYVCGKAVAANGNSVEKEAAFFIDSRAPGLTFTKVIPISETDWTITAFTNDTESGLKKLELQKKMPGRDWEVEECINYTDAETHKDRTEKFYKPVTGDINTVYRIVSYDNVGHISYTDEFTTGKPLELDAELRKLNGETAGTGETLTFYEWGDMTCWIDCETSGYADKVTVELPGELSLTTYEEKLLDSSVENNSHTFEILLNEHTMEYNQEYEVTVTAYRGTEKTVKKLKILFLEHQKVYRYIEYVKLNSMTIDWSNFFLFKWCNKLEDIGDDLGLGQR